MVLALIAERASGVPFHDLVRSAVLEPAGMVDTRLPALRRAARAAPRSATSRSTASPCTNVFHLPVRGNGDGGIYTTAADISTFWRAFFAGRIVSPDWVAEMVRPRSDDRRGVAALRARLLAAPDEHVVMARGLRCRRVVPQRARSRRPG